MSESEYIDIMFRNLFVDNEDSYSLDEDEFAEEKRLDDRDRARDMNEALR